MYVAVAQHNGTTVLRSHFSVRSYYAYIMTNRSRTLYTGVTNDLKRRVIEHKSGLGGAFTSRYAITQLVYYAPFPTAIEAIAAEKKIKGWTRAKKLALIEEKNPRWCDLSETL